MLTFTFDHAQLRFLSMQLQDKLLFETIDINNILIDPAPFQLVERTSLYKVHSLFSILALTHAYVTSIGRLVGVVTLTDVSLVCTSTTMCTYFACEVFKSHLAITFGSCHTSHTRNQIVYTS